MKKTSLRLAALAVLRERGPLHYKELTDEILARGLAVSNSKQPANSVNAILAVDIQENGPQSSFVRLRPGVFGARERSEDVADRPTAMEAGHSVSAPEGETSPSTEVHAEGQAEDETRVRVIPFPHYDEVRRLLSPLKGRNVREIAELRRAINGLRGTLEQRLDWTDPDEWIPERLSGTVREFAQRIWEKSRKTVNPSDLRGHWVLASHYGLVSEAPDGQIAITDFGRDFQSNVRGDAEVFVDEREGMLHLLGLIADNGPARWSDFLDGWTDYLRRWSRNRSQSMARYSLQDRLRNLVARGLVDRKTALYSTTDVGLEYLSSTGESESGSAEETPELRSMIRDQANAVRETLRDLLLEMDPIAFEELIRRLLEAMNYQDVEVTPASGDGGVDVIGQIELGITSVKEVVQAKRHRRTIQRKDLDALRGSLYRFNAVRGTIITTSSFSRGTLEAAFAPSVAPITLIDGEKLIDLLIEHGLGVRKRTVEILEVDPDAFAATESDAERRDS